MQSLLLDLVVIFALAGRVLLVAVFGFCAFRWVVPWVVRSIHPIMASEEP